MRLDKDECPACKHIVDAADNLIDGGGPKPNDYTVCVYCGAVNVFNEALRLRAMTPAEWEIARHNTHLKMVRAHIITQIKIRNAPNN